MIIPLIGWGLIIYALVSTNMGFTIFLFLLSIRNYTEFQWWLYAYATIFSISYFLGGVGILLHKEWARWLVLVTAVIGLIGFVIALLNAASLSPIFIAARLSGINFIANLLILPASLYLKFVPFTTSVGVEGEKEIQETKVYKEAASAVSNRSAQRRYAKIVLWSIIGAGVVLPWAINLSVGGPP